jgi:hypothetical protein
MASYTASVEGLMSGQVIINSLAGTLIGGSVAEDATTAQQVAAAFARAWESTLLTAISSQYAFVGVTCRGVTNPLVSGFAPAVVLQGTLAGSSLPTFAAAKVRLLTATPGPAGRGRTGICGVEEGATSTLTPNRLDAAPLASFQAKMDSFRQQLLASTPSITLSVVSRFKGTDAQGKPLPRVGGPLVSFVTSSPVLPELGTRVSRLR